VLDSLGTLGAAGAGFVADLPALAADARPAVRRRAALARAAITGGVASVPAGPVEVGPGLPSGRVRARLETSRGPVEVVLFADVAPRTVARFLALAQAGYYRDRRFHRVVPDFVAQTGCPRGDGWGGPGEALLDETSPLPFVRGALGIATSGRDTGGSQFFAMHAYHPHLDGEYTLFGQVTSGLEHIDALVQDEALLDVIVTER
jgi:cyclophilin family peptidyl-prolyl cis-trans isomerase